MHHDNRTALPPVAAIMSLLADVPAWLSFGGAAIGGGGIGAGLRPLLEYRKNRRRQTDEVAMALVERLQTRVERLEESSAAERVWYEARLTTLRHELKNVQGNFDALLLAIEIAPEKAAEVVAKIKARRG